MESLNLLADKYLFIIIAVLFICLLLLIILFWHNSKKLTVLQKKYDYFTKGEENVNIDQLLTKTLQELDKTQQELQELQNRHQKLREQLRGCIQKVKLERYDAFDTMGGAMSYSILLADEKNDGVILTSIYGREDNRCYAKDIKNGKSSYVLAEEEKRLL